MNFHQRQFRSRSLRKALSFAGVECSAARAGFTLVEMLVSTAIVILIMSMFAEIYGTAIQTITLQRGIGNNDQKARTVNTLLLGDLRSMTYRQAQSATGNARGLVALNAGDTASVLDEDRQQGYFYYSENDPLNDVDDVLQFTAKIGSSSTVGDVSTDSSKVFLGKAGSLGTSDNEPDFDDGYQDNVGQSRAAEISYFVRGGNLYRRVLLLRDPPHGTTDADIQPRFASGDAVFGTDATSVRNYSNFYSNFDYSATRHFDDSTNTDQTLRSYLWFNSIDSLGNGVETSTHKPIALPWNRFGHLNNQTDANMPADTIPDSIHHGTPREYQIYNNLNAAFIGRFTAEETSNGTTGYPGTFTNSFDRSVNAPLSNFVVTSLSGGSRMGEDLLLSNVESFNVEYLDPTDGFISLQTSGSAVSSFANNQNSNYGPRDSSFNLNNVFDTWHPAAFTVTSSTGATNTSPPRRPVQTNTFTVTREPLIPTPTNWSNPATPPVGSYFAPLSNNSIVYKVIDNTSGTGSTNAIEPSWSYQPGEIVTDNGVTWQCIDNRIGLKAIQITIRYRDPSKQLPKQVTLVHSFVE